MRKLQICQNKQCGRTFYNKSHTAYFIEKNKVLKVCESCNKIETKLRLDNIHAVKWGKIIWKN